MVKKMNQVSSTFTPESRQPTVSELEKAAHFAGAVVASTLRFAVIWVCAVGLGFLVHWTDVNCAFIGDSMISIGHGLEVLLYLLDSVLLAWSVGLHTVRAVVGEWKTAGDCCLH